MHSSRMRTARSSSRLGGEGGSPYTHTHPDQAPPPVDRNPDTRYWKYYLAPNFEVWGKVMFLHLCVILFTGGGLCPSMHYRSHDRWVSVRGGLPRLVTSGRYATYWNAFLFQSVSEICSNCALWLFCGLKVYTYKWQAKEDELSTHFKSLKYQSNFPEINK